MCDQGMIESSRGDRGSLAADLKSGFLSSAGDRSWTVRRIHLCDYREDMDAPLNDYHFL